METKEVPQRLSNIAVANDRFRELGFSVTITKGIHHLPDVCGLLNAVTKYKEFSEDNDPYGEHDFGTIYWYGSKVFWKIDYYNQLLSGWEDPLSKTCRRIITVMLADEY